MYISDQHKKVVLNLRQPERVLATIPTAKKFVFKGQELVAVPHRLDETVVLNNLGLKVPSPMLKHYNWPASGGRTPFKAQLETAAFLSLRSRAFVLNDLGCVDATTEYLTPTGWRKIAEYDGGEVGQYVPETGDVQFVEPTEYVKKPCHDMFRVKTKYGLDQMLSPEHRVLLVDGKSMSGKREVLSAAELYGRQEDWYEKGRNRKSTSTIGWVSAAIPTTFTAPDGDGMPLTEAELRVQIAVIADAHFPNGGSRCVVRLKKPRKKERLEQLLARAGIEFTSRAQDTATAQGYTVYSFVAPMRAKEFTSEFWACSTEQLRIVCDEVMHWDGSVSEHKPTQRFATYSKASADFVQYAFAGTGRVARVISTVRDRVRGGHRTVATEYEVSVRAGGKPLFLSGTSATAGRKQAITPCTSPDGFKYCFMVPSTFLILRRNGCIFASGNTGKTLATLWAYDYLKSIGKANRMLVASPLSTLERTWADEVFRNFPHLNVGVLHGSREKRLKLLENEDIDIYVVNHDGVKIIADAVKARDDIDVLVIDELATFRNQGSDRYKAMAGLCTPKRRVWGLTGTPTPHGPADAWAQCKLIAPDRVPKYFGMWRDQTMQQLGPFRWIPRASSTEVVRLAMQPAIRFTRDECVDLPPCMYEERNVPLTPEQSKAYKQMLEEFHAEYTGGQVTAVNAGVKMNKLLQICCGAAYGTESEVLEFPVTPRVNEVKDIIEQAGTKVIVFAPFTGVLAVLERELSKEYVCGVIHGGVSKTARDRIFAEFQHGDMKVLIANASAMSHGLTLTAANTIVWYAPVHSNETFQQANGRITRPGQKHTQFIICLEGSAVERKIYAKLQSRQSAQSVLLQMVEDGEC